MTGGSALLTELFVVGFCMFSKKLCLRPRPGWQNAGIGHRR
jgi:hypothetical protein